jgi:5-hydroxyisourate hydrolase-like protein (transthyretin family)
MPKRLKTLDLLGIAMGKHPERELDDSDLRALEMIRSAVETIRGDANDPVPTGVIRNAKALSSELPKPPSWFDRAVATVLTPLFDDRPQLAMGLRGTDLRQCTYAAGNLRLDLEVEVTNHSGTTTDEPGNVDTHVRGQIDGEKPLEVAVPVAVFVAGTDRMVASTVTEQDGRFDLHLPSGEYEFAFRLNDDLQSIGRIEIP